MALTPFEHPFSRGGKVAMPAQLPLQDCNYCKTNTAERDSCCALVEKSKKDSKKSNSTITKTYVATGS